jgi:hypothetical protein
LTFNQVVAGSIPARPTNKFNELRLIELRNFLVCYRFATDYIARFFTERQFGEFFCRPRADQGRNGLVLSLLSK